MIDKKFYDDRPPSETHGPPTGPPEVDVLEPPLGISGVSTGGSGAMAPQNLGWPPGWPPLFMFELYMFKIGTIFHRWTVSLELSTCRIT